MGSSTEYAMDLAWLVPLGRSMVDSMSSSIDNAMGCPMQGGHRLFHGRPRYITLPELHADLFSHHVSPLEVYVCGGRQKRGCYVRRDLSSIQRKTTKKEAWRPKCAAPRLGFEQNQKATYTCS